MKKDRLSEAMNYLDDELIEEARTARQMAGENMPPEKTLYVSEKDGRNGQKKNKPAVWLRRAAAAACLALCLGGGIWLWQGHGYGQPTPIDPVDVPSTPADTPPALSGIPQPTPPVQVHPSGLPMLTISDDNSVGMGYEGLMFYDISEMPDANPWSEELQLDTLPVYRNTLRADPAGAYNGSAVSAGWFEEMRALLLQTAERLGLDTASLVIGDNEPSEEMKNAYREKYASVGEELPEGLFDPTELNAEQNGVRIEVDAGLEVTVWFEPALELPLPFAVDFRMSYEQAQEAAEYYKEAYADLIGFEDPQICICGGDYTYYGEHGYGVEFFEGAEDPVRQILNFNFDRVYFTGSEEGGLWIVRLYHTDLSDKVGDYPIIPADEARQLLLQGNYISSVPYEPQAELTARVELVYRHSRMDEYYMPYYRFYIELPEGALDNGLRDFGAFYVPAVKGEYLTNMPVWDGGFN